MYTKDYVSSRVSVRCQFEFRFILKSWKSYYLYTDDHDTFSGMTADLELQGMLTHSKQQFLHHSVPLHVTGGQR